MKKNTNSVKNRGKIYILEKILGKKEILKKLKIAEKKIKIVKKEQWKKDSGKENRISKKIYIDSTKNIYSEKI